MRWRPDWLEQAGDDPLAVADGLILLPTRRAARALADAFLARTDGRPLLLPRITAFGALDEAPLALAGALSPAARGVRAAAAGAADPAGDGVGRPVRRARDRRPGLAAGGRAGGADGRGRARRDRPRHRAAGPGGGGLRDALGHHARVPPHRHARLAGLAGGERPDEPGGAPGGAAGRPGGGVDGPAAPRRACWPPGRPAASPRWPAC